MKESNKNIIIVSIIVIMVLTVIFSIIYSKNQYVKTFNIYSIKDLMNKGYDNVREMDFIDKTALFGFEYESDDNMLFMTNMENVNMFDTNSMILVVMNTEDVDDNYDIMMSFIDSFKINTDDKELLDYFDTAILEKGENYVYLILTEEPRMMEQEIFSFYY